MNKILQIWKLFFTETKSHHTVLIFKSFIYFSNMTWNKYYLFSYSCAKSSKNYDFYYLFILNFEQKNIFSIERLMRANLVSCKKSHFEQKIETVAQENLLFRVNPSKEKWIFCNFYFSFFYLYIYINVNWIYIYAYLFI